MKGKRFTDNFLSLPRLITGEVKSGLVVDIVQVGDSFQLME